MKQKDKKKVPKYQVVRLSIELYNKILEMKKTELRSIQTITNRLIENGLKYESKN